MFDLTCRSCRIHFQSDQDLDLIKRDDSTVVRFYQIISQCLPADRSAYRCEAHKRLENIEQALRCRLVEGIYEWVEIEKAIARPNPFFIGKTIYLVRERLLPKESNGIVQIVVETGAVFLTVDKQLVFMGTLQRRNAPVSIISNTVTSVTVILPHPSTASVGSIVAIDGDLFLCALDNGEKQWHRVGTALNTSLSSG